MNRNFRPLTDPAVGRTIAITQAIAHSDALGRLAEQVDESSSRLACVAPLIPAPLLAAVKAGPIDADSWCLLVTSNAAAAKLRQLSPLLISKLVDRGAKITSIRIKVLIGKSGR